MNTEEALVKKLRIVAESLLSLAQEIEDKISTDPEEIWGWADSDCNLLRKTIDSYEFLHVGA